jgi:hypothetical protein
MFVGGGTGSPMYRRGIGSATADILFASQLVELMIIPCKSSRNRRCLSVSAFTGAHFSTKYSLRISPDSNPARGEKKRTEFIHNSTTLPFAVQAPCTEQLLFVCGLHALMTGSKIG